MKKDNKDSLVIMIYVFLALITLAIFYFGGAYMERQSSTKCPSGFTCTKNPEPEVIPDCNETIQYGCWETITITNATYTWKNGEVASPLLFARTHCGGVRGTEIPRCEQ